MVKTESQNPNYIMGIEEYQMGVHLFGSLDEYPDYSAFNRPHWPRFTCRNSNPYNVLGYFASEQKSIKKRENSFRIGHQICGRNGRENELRMEYGLLA